MVAMNKKGILLRKNALAIVACLASTLFTLCSATATGAIDVGVSNIAVSDQSDTLLLNDEGVDIDALAIRPNIVFEKIGDHITYRVTLNESNQEDYSIIDVSDDYDGQYLSAEYSYSQELQDGNPKDVYISLESKKKPNVAAPDLGSFTTTIRLRGTASDAGGLDNPQTGDEVFIFFGILGVILGIGVVYFVLLKNRRPKEQNNSPHCLLLIILAISCFATLCSLKTAYGSSSEAEIRITFDFRDTEISTVTTMLLPGQEVNTTMMTIMSEAYEPVYPMVERKIVGIVRSDELIDYISESNIVSTSESEVPIYMWYVEEDQDNGLGIFYYYTEAEVISLNPNSSWLFSYLPITNIDGLADWDVSRVRNMDNMFYGATHLMNINGASNWNVSAVTDMNQMFSGASKIASLSPLNNWNVSNIANKREMFYGIPSSVARPSWY